MADLTLGITGNWAGISVNAATSSYLMRAVNEGYPYVVADRYWAEYSAVTTHPVAMPSTVDAHDLLVVFVVGAAGGTPIVWSASLPSNWTRHTLWSTNEVAAALYVKDADGTEGGTTVDFISDVATQASARIFRVKGWNHGGTLTDVVATGYTTGTSTTPDPPALDPAGWGTERTLWFAGFALGGYYQPPSVYPSGYTNGWYVGTTASGYQMTMGTAHGNNEVASENPGAFTIGGSRLWVAFTVAIRGLTSAAITTVLGTGAVGNVGYTKSGTVAITTVLGRGAVGTVGVGRELATVLGRGAVGTVTTSVSQSAALTTVLGRGAVGSVGYTETGTVAITTVLGRGAVGTVSTSITYGAVLSGVGGVAAVGNLATSVEGQPTERLGRIEVHDPNTHALIDILQNAYAVGYDLASNQSSVGSFYLPRDDPKWSSIAAFREVWMYDDLGTLIEVFRIMPMTETHSDTTLDAKVSLEGYATVLQDDIVPAEVIWTNEPVSTILTDLLAYQQTSRVTLGTVDAALDLDVTYRVSYDNLMKAAWELRNVVGGYISVDHDPADPTIRELNLLSDPGQDIGQRVWRGWNLREIGIASDPTEAVTRVYPLGRGEGPSQQRPSTDLLLAQLVTLAHSGEVGQYATLTITANYSRYKGWTAAGAALPDGSTAFDTRSRPLKVFFGATDDTANWRQGADERTLRSATTNYTPPGGLATINYVHADYLIADDMLATVGYISRPYSDKRFETSYELIRAARATLDITKAPRVSYTVRVCDLVRMLSPLDPDIDYETFHLHDIVNVWDDALGVTMAMRIVAVRYRDLDDPETMEIVVGLLDSTPPETRLQDRQRKYENMPDGATNIWVDSFEDNVDATHPYERDIYLPDEAKTVLKVALNMHAKAYRHYESAAAGSSQGSAHSHPQTWSANSWTTGGSTAHTTDGQGVHNHSDPQGGVTGDAGNHSHNVNSHTHSYDYQVVGQDTNNDSPAHYHGITVTLTPGIIEDTTHTSMQVKVDDNVASATDISKTDFDLTPYFSRASDGSIDRGWHTIKFTPNAVGRVQVNIVVEVYLQSRGVVAG